MNKKSMRIILKPCHCWQVQFADLLLPFIMALLLVTILEPIKQDCRLRSWKVEVVKIGWLEETYIRDGKMNSVLKWYFYSEWIIGEWFVDYGHQIKNFQWFLDIHHRCPWRLATLGDSGRTWAWMHSTWTTMFAFGWVENTSDLPFLWVKSVFLA